MNQLGGPVIVLHETFARPFVRCGGQAQPAGEFGLVIESQAIVAATCQQMQMNAQGGEGAFFTRNEPGLGFGEQTRPGKTGPAGRKIAGLRQPVNGVQVAQAPRAVF